MQKNGANFKIKFVCWNEESSNPEVAGVANISLKNEQPTAGAASTKSIEYVSTNFRRRKCSDLKSVKERKKEMAAHELLMRDL